MKLLTGLGSKQGHRREANCLSTLRQHRQDLQPVFCQSGALHTLVHHLIPLLGQGRLRYTYSNSQWFSEPNDLVTSTLMSAMHHLAYTLFQMAYKVQEQLLKGASITALLKSRVLFLQKLAAHNRRKMAAWVISVAGTPLLTRDLPVEIILEVGQGTACDCQTEYRDIDRIRHHAPDLWEMWWRLPSNVLSKLH